MNLVFHHVGFSLSIARLLLPLFLWTWIPDWFWRAHFSGAICISLFLDCTVKLHILHHIWRLLFLCFGNISLGCCNLSFRISFVRSVELFLPIYGPVGDLPDTSITDIIDLFFVTPFLWFTLLKNMCVDVTLVVSMDLSVITICDIFVIVLQIRVVVFFLQCFV